MEMDDWTMVHRGGVDKFIDTLMTSPTLAKQFQESKDREAMIHHTAIRLLLNEKDPEIKEKIHKPLGYVSGARSLKRSFNPTHQKQLEAVEKMISNAIDKKINIDTVTLYRQELETSFPKVKPDFEIKCGDYSLPAHLGELVGRSEYFRNLISGKWKKPEPSLELPKNFEPTHAAIALYYLQTGSLGPYALLDLESDKIVVVLHYFGADVGMIDALKSTPKEERQKLYRPELNPHLALRKNMQASPDLMSSIFSFPQTALTDEDLKFTATTWPNLKKLNLEDNKHVTQEGLKTVSFNSLIVLNLSGCGQLDRNFLAALPQQFNSFKELTLNGLKVVDDELLSDLYRQGVASIYCKNTSVTELMLYLNDVRLTSEPIDPSRVGKLSFNTPVTMYAFRSLQQLNFTQWDTLITRREGRVTYIRLKHFDNQSLKELATVVKPFQILFNDCKLSEPIDITFSNLKAISAMDETVPIAVLKKLISYNPGVCHIDIHGNQFTDLDLADLLTIFKSPNRAHNYYSPTIIIDSDKLTADIIRFMLQATDFKKFITKDHIYEATSNEQGKRVITVTPK